jgi:hypothetical protein
MYTVSFHNMFFYLFWLYLAILRKNSLTKELYADVNSYHHHHHHIHSINRFQKLQPILSHQLIKTYMFDIVDMIEKSEVVHCWPKQYDHLPLHYFHACALHIQISIYAHTSSILNGF